MSHNFEQTWDTYTSSWMADSDAEKRKLFEKSLDIACQYSDPLIKANGWDELIKYMQDFHRQIPGGYFVTKYFLAHSNKSIAKWEMRNGDHVVLGDGISYGEYNDNGKLISMTGFFEP
jgi:hypothetical protein